GSGGPSFHSRFNPRRFNTVHTVETAISSVAAILVLVHRNRRNRSIWASTRAGVRVGDVFGTEDRSIIASPASWRANHRYVVRSAQPAASAASATVQPSSRTRTHNNDRWKGVSRALPCNSIGLLEVRVARTLKSQGARPDERGWELQLEHAGAAQAVDLGEAAVHVVRHRHDFAEQACSPHDLGRPFHELRDAQGVARV